MNLKKYIKNICEKYPNYSANQIINRIRRYNYISFDVFDTLIKRYELRPEDIFITVIQKFNLEHIDNKIDEKEFFEARISSEKKCRLLNNKEEISIDDIYEELKKIYGQLANELKEIEMQTELLECYANPVFKKIYDWCLNNNKKIIIASDMYISKDFIEVILHNCGYYGYERIFVSSEIKCTKKSGEMFRYILNELSIENKTIIHIGDNLVGDYLTPIRLGIDAIKIATNPDRTSFFRHGILNNEDLKEYEKLKKYISGIISEDYSNYYKFGFEVLGPLVYCFCKWLKIESKEKEFSKLFFLSRDGYLLKKVYLELYPEDIDKVEYLYVSRKSLRLPQVFAAKDLATIMSTFRPYSFLNYKDICYGLRIDESYGKEKWILAGFKIDDTVLAKDFANDFKGQKFYELVKNQLINSSEKEYLKVLKYLNQKGFEGNVGIVDIGWAGTLQRCLERILEKAEIDTNVYGYYIGMTEEKPKDIDAKGYIPPYKSPYSLCVGIVECGFPATEGSTKCYRETLHGNINPVLLDYEYKDNPEEVSIIKEIQRGTVAFACAINKSVLFDCNLSPEAAYSNLEAFSKWPRIRDVFLFGDVEFHAQEVTALAKPRSLMTYIRKPVLLKADLNKSTWKIGFLKRLFRINLPYYRIMTVIKKII